MVHISAFHKTGTHAIKNLFKKYSQLIGGFEFKLFYDWHLKLNDGIENTKTVICIRNPYETIVSAMRYHQKTTEAWCNKLGFLEPDLDHCRSKFNNKTYLETISNLPSVEEKIRFEMNNQSQRTINVMYKSVKDNNIHNNMLFIKLEDFWTERSRDHVVRQLCSHIDSLNEDILKQAIANLGRKKYNATNKDFSYTYKDLFNKKLYEEFDDLFPNDIFDVLGYQDK